MSKPALFVFFIFFTNMVSLGQSSQVDSLYAVFDRMYGLDVILNNGKKYIPDAASIKGHPFWINELPFQADITIAGKTFRNRELKYNLAKQEFLLLYTDLNGQLCQIILNTAFIDSVETANGVFVKNKYPGIRLPFIKKIYEGNPSCYAGYVKELNFSNIGTNVGYMYSKETHMYYLIYRQKVNLFKNKASFLRIFPQEKRSVIRVKMHQLRIRFKKVDESLLRQLVEFCDHTVE